MRRTKIERTQASNVYLPCTCTVLKSGKPKHQTRIWLPCSCTVLKSGEPKHQTRIWLPCSCTVLKSGEPKHQTRIWLPCSRTVLKSGEPKHQTRIWLPCSRAVLKSGEAEATAVLTTLTAMFRHGQPCTNMADKYVFGCGAYAWYIMCKHGGQFLYLRDLVVFRHGQPCTNMAVKNALGCHVRHGQTVQDMAVSAFSNFSRVWSE